MNNVTTKTVNKFSNPNVGVETYETMETIYKTSKHEDNQKTIRHFAT